MSSDTDAWLVVGLGNPGPGYAGNRHNVGAMVIDAMAAEHGVKLRSHKARAVAADVRVASPDHPLGLRATLAVPNSFMNESGGPVAALVRFLSLAPDRLVVVHDELDIPAGDVRLKFGGGEGGHNGLRSISSALGTKDYHRVRVGIGRPPGRMDAADYVLRDFSATERKELPFTVGDAVEATEDLLRLGLLAAQQRHHGA